MMSKRCFALMIKDSCERCGEYYGGSHYHCGGCDSTDTTSMLGHYRSFHLNNDKLEKTSFHHCLKGRGGPCELDEK